MNKLSDFVYTRSSTHMIRLDLKQLKSCHYFLSVNVQVF